MKSATTIAIAKASNHDKIEIVAGLYGDAGYETAAAEAAAAGNKVVTCEFRDYDHGKTCLAVMTLMGGQRIAVRFPTARETEENYWSY